MGRWSGSANWVATGEAANLPRRHQPGPGWKTACSWSRVPWGPRFTGKLGVDRTRGAASDRFV